MLVKMYSVFDTKLNAFMLPQPYATAGVAERAFTQAVNSPGTGFAESPQDYALFEIGVFNDENGLITSHAAPLHIVNALSVVKQVSSGSVN